MVEEFLINSSAQILSVVHAISVALRRYFVVPNPTFALLNTGHGGPSVSSAARSISGVFRDWVCAAWQSAPRYTHSAVQGHGQQRCYKPAHHSDRSFKKHGKKKPAEKHTHTRMRTKFPNPKFPSSHYSRTLHLLKRINKDPVLRERALAFGISDELFSAALQDYSLSSLHANAMSTILKELAFLEEDEAFAAIFNDFLEFCKHKYKSRIEKHKLLVETLDMSNPKSWYPMARSMTRTVIYHAGPTNSGKTYNALKAMSQAGSGVYLGPLRLL